MKITIYYADYEGQGGDSILGINFDTDNLSEEELLIGKEILSMPYNDEPYEMGFHKKDLENILTKHNLTFENIEYVDCWSWCPMDIEAYILVNGELQKDMI